MPISGNGHIIIQPGASLDEIKIMEPEIESTLDLSLQLRQEKLHTDQIVNYEKGILLQNALSHLTSTVKFYIRADNNRESIWIFYLVIQ